MRLQVFPLVVALLITAALPGAARGQESLQSALRAQFESDLAGVAERLDGVLGFAIMDLTSGDAFYRLPDTVFPQASSIKITVLLELMRQAQEGKISLDEKHTVRRGETTAAVGDREPILHMLGDGTVTLSLRDLAVLMVVLSDNSATNILLERLGLENIQAGLERLGLKQTRLRRRMLDLEAARQGNENVSTPREMMTLLERIHAGGALDAAHTQEFLRILRLPKDSQLNQALPETVAIADKPGSLEAVRCDSGIIELPGRPFILAVMTSYLTRDADGERALEDVARLAYAYFDRLRRSSPYGRVISDK